MVGRYLFGSVAPSAVGAAYFFTGSTRFANPAITVGRMFSDTFAGIAPSAAQALIAAQAVGGLVGFAAIKTLYPGVTAAEAAEVVMPPMRTADPTTDGADRPHRTEGTR